MSFPAIYTTLIDELSKQIRESTPDDILQFCANYFNGRLAAERRSLHISTRANIEQPVSHVSQQTGRGFEVIMSSSFTSPFGANANPFGGGPRADTGGAMQQVLEEEEGDTLTSPTTPRFNIQSPSGAFRAPFGGGDGSADGGPSSARGPPHSDSYPTQYNFGRRTSVSAESLKPVADGSDNWQPPMHHKAADQLQRLKTAIQDNFLFSHLDDEQSAQVLGALVEKPIPAKDIKVSALSSGLPWISMTLTCLLLSRPGHHSRRCGRLLLCRRKGQLRRLREPGRLAATRT
jgi:cAMP-dependent protein kinase regulator